MPGDPAPVETEILKQAAEWFALLRSESVTADDRRRWDLWLAAHPEHRSEGGDEKAQQCGWRKDKYGAWQVVPSVLGEMINDPDSEKSQRAMEAMLQMKKIDIDELKRAYAG